MSRAAGERKRLVHAIERMRSTMVAIETAMLTKTPIGPDAAEAVLSTAKDIAFAIVREDAYERADKDRGVA